MGLGSHGWNKKQFNFSVSFAWEGDHAPRFDFYLGFWKYHFEIEISDDRHEEDKVREAFESPT
jgi:hypothetical protein